MRKHMSLAAVVPVMLGLCSVRVAGAYAPKNDAPTAVKDTPQIAESDRWFLLVPEGVGNAKESIHIAITNSGKAETPVRILYEISFRDEGGLGQAAIESLCLNDEWFSPVKVKMTFHGERKDNPPDMSAAISRPDPRFTAGKMKIEVADGSKMPEMSIKEHTVLWLTPLEMVARLPFDKERKLNFAALDWMLQETTDCALSYEGEEEIDVEGKKWTAHKFVQKLGDGGKTNAFWLDADHHLVRAHILYATMTPVTAEEARKAMEGAKMAEPAKQK